MKFQQQSGRVADGYKAATIGLERAMLRRLFSYAQKNWLWIAPARNLAAGLNLPPIDNVRTRIISNDEWKALIAIDDSKFKAVNNRDKNFTPHKLEQRIKQIEESIERYMHALDTADRTQPAETEAKTKNLKEKLVRLKNQMRYLQSYHDTS